MKIKDIPQLAAISNQKRDNALDANRKSIQLAEIRRAKNILSKRYARANEKMAKIKDAGELPTANALYQYGIIMCETNNLHLDFPCTAKNLAMLRRYISKGDFIVSGLALDFSEYIKHLVTYWEFFCNSKYNTWVGCFPDVLPLYRLLCSAALRDAFHAYIRESKTKKMEQMTATSFFRDRIVVEGLD